MNAKAMVPLVLAVVLGLTAALLVRSAMGRKQTVSAGPGNLVAVVVAKLDADPGHAIGPEDVGTARLPADTVPAGVFSDPAQLIGRVTVSPLVKGETILETRLAPTGSASGLAALVPPGMRAMTLEVTEYSGVGGMLEPGCRVDIVCVLHAEDPTHKGGGTTARTVLQNIKVSAIGHNISPVRPAPGQPAPPPSNSVTLLCTPKQVQTLELATSTGRPWLVLRSTRDGTEVPLDGTSMAELSGQPADAAPADATAAAATDPEPALPLVVPAMSPSPTTAPVADATPARVPAMIRRTVVVFNGEVESHASVMVANPRAMSVPAPAMDTADIDPTNYATK